jgi:Spy/CpxP family protein refolding chaperone
MESNSKNKWQVRIAAVIIFALGFAAGALSLNLYNSRQSAEPDANRPRRIEQMLDRLNLNQDQRARMEEIMKDTRARMDAERDTERKASRPRMQEIRDESRRRMQEVLNPAQWDELQKMMKDNRDGRRRRRGGDR